MNKFLTRARLLRALYNDEYRAVLRATVCDYAEVQRLDREQKKHEVEQHFPRDVVLNERRVRA